MSNPKTEWTLTTRLMAGLFVAILMSSPVKAAPADSHFPHTGLGSLLANKFDLATIRSSFGPRRTPSLRTFTDLGLKPTQSSDDAVVFLRPGDWLYELRVVARGDFNRDGIEDLKVCFVDRALNGGTYDTAQGVLLTRYSSEGYVIAISFSIGDEVCSSYTK